MLKEAIDRIAELGCQSAGIEIKALHHRTKLVRMGNKYESIEVGADPLHDKVETAEDLVRMVEALPLPSNAVIYVGEQEITAVLDIVRRDDRVVLPLKTSPQFDALIALSNPTDQRTLIRYLREELDGAIEQRFLAIVRRMDFKRVGDGRAHLEHGKESLGRSVESAVQSSEGEIPETLLVQLECFTVLDLPSDVSVRCAVTIDHNTEKFTVRPVGNDLNDELMRIRLSMASRIRSIIETEGSDAMVVVGSPGS